MMKPLLSVALLSAVLAGCVSQSQRAVVAEPPADNAKRIVRAGNDLVLPDGTRVTPDSTGGFTLPNGAYVERDRGGALVLPTGARCAPNAGGYVCP